MSALDLFAAELKLPTGETVAIPPALLEAVQDACPTETIDGDALLAAGRDAFMRRFVESLFARGLIVLERGRSTSRETVGLDAYTLVCSQKHELQRQARQIRQLVTGEQGLSHGDLAEVLDELLAVLTGRAPVTKGIGQADEARAAIGHRLTDLRNRIATIRRLALGLSATPPMPPGPVDLSLPGALEAAAGAGGVK